MPTAVRVVLVVGYFISEVPGPPRASTVTTVFFPADHSCFVYVHLVDQTLEFLQSSAYKEEVEELIEEAQDRGISGVPYTVINLKWAIAGGQTAETYYNVSLGLIELYQACSFRFSCDCG